MNGREFSMMLPGTVAEHIDNVANSVAREIMHRSQATMNDGEIIEIIVKAALVAERTDAYNKGYAAEQRRADDSIRENVRLMNELTAEREKRADWNIVIEDLERDNKQLRAELAAAKQENCNLAKTAKERLDWLAAAQAKLKEQLLFLNRCADHMISGSNIADTPIPAIKEWQAILRATDTAALDAYVRKVVDEKVAIVKELHTEETQRMLSNAITYERAKLQPLVDALKSIAANTCCDKCQEAALVAKAALDKVK